MAGMMSPLGGNLCPSGAGRKWGMSSNDTSPPAEFTPKGELISLSEKPNVSEEELGPEGMKFQEKFSGVYKMIPVSSRN
jgi:hypothetical protein